MGRLPQVHLSWDDPLAIRFCDHFWPGSPRLTVLRQGNEPAAQCYQNVRKHIAKHGGEAQLGWLISMLPGKYIEGLHHAVWKSVSGDLVDITQRAYAGMGDTITFVPTNEGLEPLFDPIVSPVFSLLSNEEGLHRYARILSDRARHQQAAVSLVKKYCNPQSINDKLLHPLPPEVARQYQELRGEISKFDRALSFIVDRFLCGEYSDPWDPEGNPRRG